MLLEGDDEAHHPSAYSRDNGRRWTTIDEYVQNCAWARDARLAADPNEILCESFRDKKGSQRMFGGENEEGEVEQQVEGLFDEVVGMSAEERCKIRKRDG